MVSIYNESAISAADGLDRLLVYVGIGANACC